MEPLDPQDKEDNLEPVVKLVLQVSLGFQECPALRAEPELVEPWENKVQGEEPEALDWLEPPVPRELLEHPDLKVSEESVERVPQEVHPVSMVCPELLE